MEGLSASEHIHSKKFRFIHLFNLIAKRLNIQIDAYEDIKWFLDWHERHLKGIMREPELKLYEVLMENTSDDLKESLVLYTKELKFPASAVCMIDGDWTEAECDIVMRIWELYDMYRIGENRDYPNINNYPLGVVFSQCDILKFILEELSSQNA